MENKQVDEYIQKARQSGLSDEQIKKELLRAGWDDASISQISNQKIFPTRSHVDKKLLVAGLILFLLVGGVIFGYYILNSSKRSDTRFPIINTVQQEEPIISNSASNSKYKFFHDPQRALNSPVDFQYPGDWDVSMLPSDATFTNSAGTTVLMLDYTNLRKLLQKETVSDADALSVITTFFQQKIKNSLPSPIMVNNVNVYQILWSDGSEKLDQLYATYDGVLYVFSFNADSVSADIVDAVIQSLHFSSADTAFLERIAPYGTEFKPIQELQAVCPEGIDTCIQPRAVSVKSCGSASVDITKNSLDTKNEESYRFSRVYCMGNGRNDDQTSGVKFTAGQIVLPPSGSGSTRVTVQARYNDDTCLAEGDYECFMSEEVQYADTTEWTQTFNDRYLNFVLRVEK